MGGGEGDMRCKKPWQRAYLLCGIRSRMRLRSVVKGGGTKRKSTQFDETSSHATNTLTLWLHFCSHPSMALHLFLRETVEGHSGVSEKHLGVQ